VKISQADGECHRAGKSVPMKFLTSALCGALLVLPVTAGIAFAQSSTTGSSTAAKQTAPSSAAAGSPSNRSITALTPGTPAPPAHPITLDQTREFLDLMGYKQMEENNWSQLIAMNRRAAPFIPEDVWTDVQNGINGIDYAGLMQPIYAKYLSQEDASKALEFYRTPAGKRVLQSFPPMLGAGVAAAQQKGHDVGRDVIEKHKPEIEEAQKKYQAEHAPAASPTPGAGSTTPAPSTTPATPPPTTTKPQR
jgi:uncharacterized protein